MRETIPKQLPIVPNPVKHTYATEIKEISRILDGLPTLIEAVAKDLARGVRFPLLGRRGLSAEQVLRAAIWQRSFGLTFEELAFQVADSGTARAFCRMDLSVEPKKSALQRDVSRIRPETWEAINRAVVLVAQAEGIEAGNRARVDSTAMASHIEQPTDSGLLNDGVRVLARLMGRVQEFVPGYRFSKHDRAAKRRMRAIHDARGKDNKLGPYEDLLRLTQRTVWSAQRAIVMLRKPDGNRDVDGADKLANEIDRVVGLVKRVLDQTRRRVLDGESVPATEKLVSLFETHADIIRKDHRETTYGHKVFLTVGEKLITDCFLPRGNPADATLAIDLIQRQQQILGSPPRDVAMDGGFASKDNLAAIKALGVENVCFSKGRGLTVDQMVDGPATYRTLRGFRAGIESFIGFLKGCMGLARCFWRGFQGFQRYVWSTVVTANLLTIARLHLTG